MRPREFSLDPIPSNLSATELADFLNGQFQKLNEVVTQLLVSRSPVLYSAPLKPRVGVLAYADGTVWDPGSGEGMYEFRSDGLWHKL